MHMSHDFSGFSALRNLKELELCPEMTSSVIGLYTFDGEFSQLTALRRLQLVNVGLTELPTSIASNFVLLLIFNHVFEPRFV